VASFIARDDWRPRTVNPVNFTFVVHAQVNFISAQHGYGCILDDLNTAVGIGLYPIVTSQYSSTTFYLVSYLHM
jgi:hypothetical protein